LLSTQAVYHGIFKAILRTYQSI